MATSHLVFILFVVVTSGNIFHHPDAKTSSKKVHQCLHDTLDIKTKQQHVKYHNHPYDVLNHPSFSASERRKLAEEADYSLIRISPYYDSQSISTDNGLTNDQITSIKQLVSASARYVEQFLSVIPVDGALFINPCGYYFPVDDETTAGEYNLYSCSSGQLDYACGQATIPDDHTPELWLYDATTGVSSMDQESGSGIADTDLIVYVTYSNTETCTSGTTLAHAGSCFRDQYGRPIAGSINFCPIMFDEPYWKFDVRVVLHELTHVLALSSSHFSSFYNVDAGTYYERSEVIASAADSGTDNEWIITDKVKEVAREHFGCDSMIGAPLENSGGTGTAGSHWEGKYINTEYMIGTSFDALERVSMFTLALLEDSGWYKVDYNYAEPYVWGRDEGCSFLNDECITDSTATYPQFWCDTSYDHGCTADFSAIGWCYLPNSASGIPSEFKYYSDNVAGSEMHDYCGFVDPSQSGDFASICWDERGNTLDQASVGASTYAVDSRCVDTIADDGTTNEGYCFKHECTGFDSSTLMYSGVDITIGANEVITCSRDDELNTKTVSTTGLSSIKCPNIDAICGTSTKPFECYFGEYNDELEQCVCSAGSNGTLCNTDDNAMIQEATAAIPSPVETTIYDSVCISGITVDSRSYLNGLFVVDGTNEGITSYINSTNAPADLYLYYQRYQVRWMFGSAKGASGSMGYCRQYVSANDEPDIEQCTEWNIYDGTDYVTQTLTVTYDDEVCDGSDDPDGANRSWVNMWAQCMLISIVIIMS